MKYNLCQQTFVLSMLSNQLVQLAGATAETKASLERQLGDSIVKVLNASRDLMGDWEIVWGPAVYVDSCYQHQAEGTGVADNAVYVAHNRSTSVYVVALAGTNRYSKYGKQDEDGEVERTTLWTHAFKTDHDGNPLLGDYGNPTASGTPCLSLGTADGVQACLCTRPEGESRHLVDFLKGLTAAGSTLIVTGHSLGGALAPTLALALFNPNGGPLQASQWRAVHVLPTAGATPGNGDLSEAFASVFPGIPAEVPDDASPAQMELWNRNIASPHDFVPMAWVPEEMSRVPPGPPGSAWNGLYPRLEWASEALKQKLRLAIGLAMKRSTRGASSRPEGTPLGSRITAGAYVKLPHIVISTARVQEVDPTDRIVALGQATPPDVAYVDHWLKQHAGGYIAQIFAVGEVLQGDSSSPLLRSGAASFLGAPDGAA